MQISHETPLFLLEESRSFNDYDYALGHLLNKYSKYYEFFKNSLKLGRKVILDNGAYELKESIDIHLYASLINELKPTIYIIPDAIANKERTLELFENFIKNYKDLPGQKMGVIQGKNIKEYIECFTFMSNKCDIIGIPANTPDNFSNNYFENYFQSNTQIERIKFNIEEEKMTKDERKAYFRIKLIEILLEKNYIKSTTRLHLLGCNLPQEYLFLKNFKCIESADTSFPIMCGILNIDIEKENIRNKPFSLFFDNIIDIEKEKCDVDLIYKNIKTFKKFI